MSRRGSQVIKIAIADDHAVVRKGLMQIISENSDMVITAEAGDGHELLKKIRNAPPDVVLLDINMPGKSGWDVMSQLHVEFPKLPVIILSMAPEEDYAVKFFKAGASGYLSKSSAPEQLVAAIRKVAAGGKFITPELAEQLAFTLAENKDQAPHEKLSPREFQVMCLIASGKTVSEIAESLGLSVPTISTHRARILQKMHLKNNSQLTNYAYKHKLID